MLEVAEGIRHIHSEGIVHGDLRGVRIRNHYSFYQLKLSTKENIFLDADFHCQIADIGLTSNTDAIITVAPSAFLFNYTAPELFFTQSESDDELYEGHDSQKGSKTVETDIYAFGCLYYAVRFSFLTYSGSFVS